METNLEGIQPTAEDVRLMPGGADQVGTCAHTIVQPAEVKGNDLEIIHVPVK